MIHLVVPAARAAGILEYLDGWGRAVAPRMRVIHYEQLPALRRVPAGAWIFAAIDRLGPGMERLAATLHDRLVAQGLPALNDPARALRRYGLLDALHQRGLNKFRALRASGPLDALRFPVFLRQESEHGGALSELLHSRRAVDAAIGRALLHGHRLGDLLVIEFCDTADATGTYRKYSAFVVGDEIVPRSLAIGPGWMLKHSGTDFTRAMVLEEQEYVLTNKHAAELRTIFDIAGAGYGRIDYALLDGRIQTWEINYNPTIGRGRLRPSSGRIPEELQPLRDRTKEHFYDAFRAAFERLDVEVAGDLALEAEAGLTRAAAGEAAAGIAVPRSRRWLRLSHALQPLRPVLDPIADRVLPLVARARLFSPSTRP